MAFDNISVSSGIIDSTEGNPIRWDLYTPISGTRRIHPVILFIHGFKGFKDWGAFPDACEELARSGFGVVAFNLSLNGTGENKYEFERLDLFTRQTFSQDLNDIATVIDALQKGKIKNTHTSLNTDCIGIIGHSRGGHLAVVAAAEFEAIRCLVTWSAVANYLEFWSDSMKSDWDKNGVTEIMNSRTNQTMPLNKSVFEDAQTNEHRVIALHRVKEVVAPSLFIHGKEDETVPQSHAEELYSNSGAKKKAIKLIAKAGHTYGVSHPFELIDFPKPFQKLIDETIDWFDEYLK